PPCAHLDSDERRKIMAHQTRWGWYPCDYATFRLLKQLHTRFWEARRRYAEWRRWERKQPQNRVLRERVVDEQGNKAGSRILGPKPEPLLDPLFCTREKVVRHWNKDGKHLRDGETVERICFADHGLPETYRLARRPAATEAEVPLLPLTVDAIRRL